MVKVAHKEYIMFIALHLLVKFQNSFIHQIYKHRAEFYKYQNSSLTWHNNKLVLPCVHT